MCMAAQNSSVFYPAMMHRMEAAAKMILRDDRSWLGEPAGGKGSDVDRRRTAGNEIGDNFAGHRCGGHADMAVAKGVDDVRRSTRPTKNRQRVGQARAMAHPDRDPLFGVGG